MASNIEVQSNNRVVVDKNASVLAPVVKGVAETKDVKTELGQKNVVDEKDQEALQDKVAQLNQHVQSLNRNLQFQIDDDSGKIIVKVIDSDTEEVVRQIPSEEVLSVSNASEKLSGILFDHSA